MVYQGGREPDANSYSTRSTCQAPGNDCDGVRDTQARPLPASESAAPVGCQNMPVSVNGADTVADGASGGSTNDPEKFTDIELGEFGPPTSGYVMPSNVAVPLMAEPTQTARRLIVVPGRQGDSRLHAPGANTPENSLTAVWK